MKSTTKNNSIVYLPLAGIAGPVQSTIIIVICSTLRPGYDHIDQFISDLGATGTSHADLMNFAGFIPLLSGVYNSGSNPKGLSTKKQNVAAFLSR